MSERASCEEVLKLLGPFWRKELGATQSDLVRGHVRRCCPCEERLSQFVAAELLAERPDVFEPHQGPPEIRALAASLLAEQSRSEDLSLEGIIDEWNEYFDESADPASQSEP